MNPSQQIFSDFWNKHHEEPNFYDMWIAHCDGDVALAMEYDFFQTREEMDSYFIKMMGIVDEVKTMQVNEKPWHIVDEGNGNWSVGYDNSTE